MAGAEASDCGDEADFCVKLAVSMGSGMGVGSSTVTLGQTERTCGEGVVAALVVECCEWRSLDELSALFLVLATDGDAAASCCEVLSGSTSLCVSRPSSPSSTADMLSDDTAGIFDSEVDFLRLDRRRSLPADECSERCVVESFELRRSSGGNLLLALEIRVLRSMPAQASPQLRKGVVASCRFWDTGLASCGAGGERGRGVGEP
jgi:hypothetical protein